MTTNEYNHADLERQKKIDDWLPVTASRRAKWWYSTFHNVTAIVGAGVLGLPFALSQLGWIGGLCCLLASWMITFYSLWQLVEMHEEVPGRRFDRYHELGQHAFGPKLGLWIVVPQQLLVQVSSDIVYGVTGGKSLKKFFELVIPSMKSMKLTWFILIFGGIQLVLSQSPNFNSLRGVSLLAAFMSFCYSAIAFIASLIKGKIHGVDYGLRSSSKAGIIFDIFNAMGTIGFAFAGHSVCLEIQATIPSTSEKPSTKPMWHGVVVAYLIVAVCYSSVAVTGFWAFGNVVEDDVLMSFGEPSWLIAVANFMVFLHVLGSYQVFAMPLFDMLESFLVIKCKLTPSLMLRMVARSIYVCVVTVIGLSIPFFGGLLGFFGGLVFAPTSYFLPCVMWLILRKPKVFSFHWIACWISIVLGSLLMILSPIGGLRSIIVSAISCAPIIILKEESENCGVRSESDEDEEADQHFILTV